MPPLPNPPRRRSSISLLAGSPGRPACRSRPGAQGDAALTPAWLLRRQTHCGFVTLKLHFYDTASGPGLRRAPAGVPSLRLGLRGAALLLMALPPQPGPAAPSAAAGLAAISTWRW